MIIITLSLPSVKNEKFSQPLFIGQPDTKSELDCTYDKSSIRAAGHRRL